MGKKREAFIGIDTSKLKNAIAIADGGRGGEIRYVGEIPNTPEATRKLIAKLTKQYRTLYFCYEAGPTGYGLQRTITEAGHECMVVAPSLIPTKPGDHVKTNRRDAIVLAKLLRADELTQVWVPDIDHEAIRDLIRTREASVRDLRAKRQQVMGFLLRQGRIFPGRKTWSKAYMRWLSEQSFEHHAHHLVLQEGINAARDAEERLTRVEQTIAEMTTNWSLAPIVDAIQAMRGIEFVAAVTIIAELGDLSRFENPRQLMAYLGLVPSESSTGDSVRRGSITKAGNSAARRILVECAWHYRHPARIGAAKRAKIALLPKDVTDIAWKAQTRLCRRYRIMTKSGKLPNVAVVAIAREMAAFIWAIARQVNLMTNTAKTSEAAPC
ncbi:MAG: IS110 family transposase [Pseudomonadota bacterium]